MNKENYEIIIQQCVEKWSMLLEDLDGFKKEQVAILLENQYLFNNRLEETGPANIERWKRLSIPMVRRTYSDNLFFDIFDLVSFQSLLGPCSLFYWEEAGEILSKEWVTRSKRFKTSWNYESNAYFQLDVEAYFQLDVEVELASMMSQSIALELAREIMTDLRNNAGTDLQFQKKDGLSGIKKTSNIIESKIGNKANWMILGRGSLVDAICASPHLDSDSEYDVALGINKIGRMDDVLDIYFDPLYPINECLMGFKGNNLQAGYFYGTYIPFNLLQPTINPYSFCPQRGIMTRYAKSLVNKDYYAKIKLV